MERKRFKLDREAFSCPICVVLLNDPVTIPCGHSFCMNCIKLHWDEEDKKDTHSCPQCRQTFTPRPDLVKSTMLADLVEELKKTGLQAALDEHCYAGAEDEACDVCTGRKRKAFKSCLVCLASFCEKHLQPHYESAAFKKHKLAEPSKKLQENICSRHDEVVDHDIVAAAADMTERQRRLEESQLNIQLGIQDREKYVQMLEQEMETIEGSADKAVEDSEKIFTELIRHVESRRSHLKQQVRSQQQTEVDRVTWLQEQLREEISELQKLSHTEDHTQFLHNFPKMSALHQLTSNNNIRPLRYFEDVTAVVSGVRDELQDDLTEKWQQITVALTHVDVFLPNSLLTEPKDRADFLQYSRDITLDPNTANNYVVLSNGKRKATFTNQQQSYPSHPDRFTDFRQVLSRQSLTGRCYWEVESIERGIHIAVAYKNISRTGSADECAFGFNDKSWALRCSKNSFYLVHNKVNTQVTCPVAPRVGVYLDHREGILSFYSVSETTGMTLLHRAQTMFTQPLHAGLLCCFSHTDSRNAEFLKPEYTQVI